MIAVNFHDSHRLSFDVDFMLQIDHPVPQSIDLLTVVQAGGFLIGLVLQVLAQGQVVVKPGYEPPEDPNENGSNNSVWYGKSIHCGVIVVVTYETQALIVPLFLARR